MTITTTKAREVVDITDEISAQVPAGVGMAMVFAAHSTAAVTTADLEPGTDQDFLDFLKQSTPKAAWRHPHNPAHAPDHLLASLIGPSIVVPYVDGQLHLGAWQRVVLVELDGPRDRNVFVTFLPSE
jgi:secondary thiamine-phosphate synthase enzyme